MRRSASGNALLTIRDLDTDEDLDVEVPAEHEHHWIGWGERPRLRWGTDRWGVEVERGDYGVRAVDQDGRRHLVPHSSYSVVQRMRKAAVETKGKKVDLKPGDRWITIHPHGDDEKGVPVLIRPQGDGTHRIIGGAGGKLTHLRLKGVSEPTDEKKAEWAATSKDRKAKKDAKEAERQAAQSPEDSAKEKASKDAIKAAEKAAERAFVEKVRTGAGGVDADLAPEQLQKFRSSGARNLELARHHNRQFRQAMQRTKELAAAKVDQELTETERRMQIDAAIEEAPTLAASVRALAETELELQAVDDAERSAERRMVRTRTSATRDVGERAAEQARSVLDATPDPEPHLTNLGGRIDPKDQQQMALSRLPSEEVDRRAAQSLSDAVILHKAANGEELDQRQKVVVEKIAERQKIDPQDEGALRREAARQLRRNEILESQAKKLKSMEEEGNEAGAMVALAYTDMLKGIADDAHVARQLGLTVADKVPITEPEMAAIGDLMQDAGKLREAKKQFKAMMSAVEGGDYDQSRRAYNLKIEDVTDAVAETEADLARRQITDRLLGIANPKAEAHIQAVAEGHYLTLAEVGLGIGKSRYLDRPTIDAIGAKNACVLQRFALEQDGHDREAVLQALEDTHVGQLVETSQRAITAAERFAPGLASTVEDVGSIEKAVALLDMHQSSLDEIQREVGGALGRMEALATQAQAFRGALPSHLEMQARDQWDNTLQWLHAAGLAPGDYELNRKDKTVRIPQRSWAKLIHKEGPEVVKIRETVDAIKAGKKDEKGWLPAGFTKRPESTFTADIPTAKRYWEPLALPSESGGYQAAIEKHVGLRIADGEGAADILKDLNSAPMLAAARDGTAYAQALRTVFPVLDAEGNLTPMSTHAAYHQSLAERSLAEAHPGEASLHAQGIDLEDKGVKEALYRSLAAEPRLKLAHTPITAMTHEDRAALRSYFYERVGIKDPKHGYAEQFKRGIEGYTNAKGEEVKGIGPEPDKNAGTGGMFGGGGPSKEWREWSEKALQLAGKYPMEGKDLALRALGDQPKQVRNRNVTDQVAGVLDRLKSEEPNLGPADLALRARAELAPELPAEKQAQAADAARRLTHIEHQQWLERHPDASATDAETALKKRHDSILAHETLKAKAAGGPALIAGDVHGYLAPKLWQDAVDHVKGWSAKSTPWSTYVEMHGGLDLGMQALQDELAGKLAASFQAEHGKLTGKPLRMGKADVTNREHHLAAAGTPEEQAAYRAQKASDMRAIQSRDALQRYTSMGGAGALVAAQAVEKQRDRAAEQQQGGLFGASRSTTSQKMPEVKLEPGERHTLGSRIEGQLRSLMPVIGGQLHSSAGPMSLVADANMDGDRIHQQRSLKQFAANGGRIGLYGGTGFGKTPTMFGALTNAIEKGQAPHGGIFITPQKVQAQFDGEMANFLEPGKYKWKTGEGMGHDERVAMLKDPSLHMRVMTHQSFMRTAQKLVADHHGWKPEEVGEKLGEMSAAEAAGKYREAMDAAGIPKMFTAIDEAHMVTHRDSTEWGGLHALARAASHPTNATHALFATATPHKNDTSELYSMASLVDPERYHDRAAFMSAFGGGIEQNPDSIRRELAHLTYSAAIPPEGVERHDMENVTVDAEGRKVPNGAGLALLPEHQKLVDGVTAAFERAQKAAKRGDVDVDAIKQLAAPGRFEGVPEGDHEKIAKALNRSLGILKDSAMRRAIELAPAEHNTKLQAMTKVLLHDRDHAKWTDAKTGEQRNGKASIVFANSAAAVRLIQEHLKSQGLRAETITGATGADEMKRVLGKFPRPETGKAREADVLIGTSSIEAGLNAQFAQSTHHFDVPLTEKAFAQRSGRAYRQKQRADVDNHSWHTDSDYDRTALSRLKRKTGLANVFQTNSPHLDESGIAEHYQRVQDARHQGFEPDQLAAK